MYILLSKSCTSIIFFQTVNQYSVLEEQYTNRPPLNLSHADVISPTCYDAMWTFAYALNHTLAGMAKQVHVESKTGCFLCMYIYMYIHADMHVECMPTWIPYANAAYPLTSPRGSKVKINVKLVRRKRESLGTRLAFFYITILLIIILAPQILKPTQLSANWLTISLRMRHCTLTLSE